MEIMDLLIDMIYDKISNRVSFDKHVFMLQQYEKVKRVLL